jgi:tetratricopeptide (TPR) repeat protein
MSGQILTPDRRIRVFLSSRLNEFASERQSLVSMIQSEMRFTPIYFEEQARPHPPRELYSSYLAQSEIFVGIYGVGYGWIDENGGMTISGLHDEWKLSQKLPRLIFVKETKQPRDSRLVELLKEVEASGAASFIKFRTKTELLKKVAEAIAVVVSERFIDPDVSAIDAIPNYAVELTDGFKSKQIIETVFFTQEVEPVLRQIKRLLIVGPPGIGKTVTLFKIAQNTECIYISLRNRSLLSAASHLSNRLSQIAQLKARSFASADDALQSCESLLQRVKTSVLIDDSEQSIDVAVELAKLSSGRSRVILASRLLLPILPDDCRVLNCHGFTPEESTQFVHAANPALASSISAVIQKSGGNPLYLTYFTQAGLAEPAQSIDDYHRTMWARLLANQKEVISVIALSELAPTFDGLAGVLADYRQQPLTGISVRDECTRIAHLVSIQQKQIRLFHTAFRDFVIKQIAVDGLDLVLHRSIGNALSKAGYIYFSIYHLVLGGKGDSVYDQLISAATWAQFTGRMVVARKVLAAVLRLGRQKCDFETMGFALHHVAMLGQHSRCPLSNMQTAILAEKMFERTKKRELIQIGKMTTATFLAEVGKSAEAISRLKEVAAHFQTSGLRYQEAVARTNLGYVYLRVGSMGLCEQASLKALKTMRKIKNYYGICTALTNMQAVCISRHDLRRHLAIAKELLTISRKMNWPRIEAAAQNGFTVFYRRTKQHRKAEEACKIAMQIAADMGLSDLQFLNKANLGNIYKDQMRFDEARQCYEYCIAEGMRHGFKRAIATGKELLADLLEESDGPTSGIELGVQAIKLYREIGDAYRVATTLDSQAGRFNKLKRPIEAATAYFHAAESWWQTNIIKESVSSYLSAIELFLDIDDEKSAAACLECIWKKLADHEHHETALRVFNNLSSFSKGPSLLVGNPRVTESIPTLIFEDTNCGLISNTIANVTGVFRKRICTHCDTVHLDFLKSILEQYNKRKIEKLIFALAIAIEQAPETLFKMDEYKQLCDSVAEGLPELNYRCDSLIIERWIVHLPTQRVPAIEFQLASDQPSIRAVAALFALIIWTQRKKIVSQIGKRKWFELGLSVNIFSENECRKRGMPGTEAIKDEFPAVFSHSNVPRGKPQPLCAVIVGDNFLSLADRVQHPDNKHIIWMLMVLYNILIGHFTHFGIPKNTVNKLRREFICDTFGVQIHKRSARVVRRASKTKHSNTR